MAGRADLAACLLECVLVITRATQGASGSAIDRRIRAWRTLRWGFRSDWALCPSFARLALIDIRQTLLGSKCTCWAASLDSAASGAVGAHGAQDWLNSCQRAVVTGRAWTRASWRGLHISVGVRTIISRCAFKRVVLIDEPLAQLRVGHCSFNNDYKMGRRCGKVIDHRKGDVVGPLHSVGLARVA